MNARCTFRSVHHAGEALEAGLVMPTAEDARRRLVNDDPRWEGAEMIQADPTLEAVTGWGEIGFSGWLDVPGEYPNTPHQSEPGMPRGITI